MKVLSIVESARLEHGIRHNDFKRYKSYCKSRVQKSKSLLFNCERALFYSFELKKESEEDYRKLQHSRKRLLKALKYSEMLMEEGIRSEDETFATEAKIYHLQIKVEFLMFSNDFDGALAVFDEIFKDTKKLLLDYPTQLKELKILHRFCQFQAQRTSEANVANVSVSFGSRTIEFTPEQGENYQRLTMKLQQLEEERSNDFMSLKSKKREELIRKELDFYDQLTVICYQATLEEKSTDEEVEYFQFHKTVFSVLRVLKEVYVLPLKDAVRKHQSILHFIKQNIQDEGLQQAIVAMLENILLLKYLYTLKFKSKKRSELLAKLAGNTVNKIEQFPSDYELLDKERQLLQVLFDKLSSEVQSNDLDSKMGDMSLENKVLTTIGNLTVKEQGFVVQLEPMPVRPILYDLAYTEIEDELDRMEVDEDGQKGLLKSVFGFFK